MRVQEVKDTTGLAKQTDASNSENPSSSKTILQYPAQRASANDSGTGLNINKLYQNGLLFTAHNMTMRQSKELQSWRKNNSNKIVGNTGVLNNTVATILMPRSISEADSITHKLSDVKDSQYGKGGGTVTGMISSMVSNQVWKAIEGAAGGALFADHGEQMYTATRSTYQGADKRTKIFSWHLVPQNSEDLKQIMSIYQTFNRLSYGSVGRSGTIDDTLNKLKTEYAKILQGDSATKVSGDDTLLGQISTFLTNVNVVSNPTLWMVRNFYSNDTEANLDVDDVFGPAQIQGVRFDKTPDGHFNGLSKYPNVSGSFMLEVTMKEVISLTRDHFPVL